MLLAMVEALREGARRLLLAAIEADVDEYIEKHQQGRDAKGHRLVVRNGYAKERRLLTGLGELAVRAPRVNDKRRDTQGRRIAIAAIHRRAGRTMIPRPVARTARVRARSARLARRS